MNPGQTKFVRHNEKSLKSFFIHGFPLAYHFRFQLLLFIKSTVSIMYCVYSLPNSLPTDLRAKALELRVRKLEQELAEVKGFDSSSTTTASSLEQTLDIKDSLDLNDEEDSYILAFRLKRKEEECQILQTLLESKSREFDNFRMHIQHSVKAQIQAYIEHEEQVKSLQTLAAKDRVWLEQETSRRRAASVAMRKEVESKVKGMQRRLTTTW